MHRPATFISQDQCPHNTANFKQPNCTAPMDKLRYHSTYCHQFLGSSHFGEHFGTTYKSQVQHLTCSVHRSYKFFLIIVLVIVKAFNTLITRRSPF